MLSKLLKNDLKVNMRWLWILFTTSILVACISRGCKELGDNIAFFKILGIFFDSAFYAIVVNVILQPFLRSFLNFSKSLYGDESYLTHTLPATKNQLIKSKFLTALIEITIGFMCLILSFLIRFASPNMFDTLRIILSTLITGKFSLFLVITLFILFVIVEFFMYISIIYLSIIIAYRSKEKRVLKTFLISVALAFVSITVLSIVLIVVLLLNKVKLSSSILVISSTSFLSIIITGIIVYTVATIVFYILTKKEFNKGVNVD